MKFTEEQYEKIIDSWNTSLTYDKATKFVIDYVNSLNSSNYEAALALANSLTRERAREQYVEKEKRYVWYSKKNNVHGKPVRLFKDAGQAVRSFPANRSDMVTQDEHLTESEIREWGYDPERFDKEEVE
ncbi:hypothetical protein [Leuconostoc holzapfelii]|uniref:DUF1642 domain-containing protein n=1 Tax=Leuconostoc holzapfelii TaxID=434464 RepID=A0A846ZHB2_9LACO|nr:hypothetical protein [Leuconostoc holzapfelii]NKZ18552.1 hypothetical protein [Leuconostoc holzapfelii]